MRVSDDEQRMRRERLVAHGILARGVVDRRVLEAMRAVPRDRFVSERLRDFAYDNTPLPIGEGQTISQPLVVAIMVEAAEVGPSCRVLEVGTGSGYGAAVLGHLAGEVWTVERHDSLAEQARTRLEAVGCDNVHVVCGDGAHGLPDRAPFDAIIVTAGAPAVPDALVEQLTDDGRLVIPVGCRPRSQRLRRVRRDGAAIMTDEFGAVRFVPLVGDHAWPP